MTFYGGFILALIVGSIYVYVKNLDGLRLFDISILERIYRFVLRTRRHVFLMVMTMSSLFRRWFFTKSLRGISKSRR